MNIIILIILFVFIYLIKDGFEQFKLHLYGVFPYTNNKFEKVPLKKRKILIITAEDRNDDYIKYHDINFKKYCKLHDYIYLRLDNCSKEESSTYWCKIHKVKKALENTEFDYVMWADSDTIITDLNVSLDSFISDVGEPDIIIGKDVGINVFNAGLFLIKNSKMGKYFINRCLEELGRRKSCLVNGKEQGFWGGICYEQGLMNLIIREQFNNYTYVDKESELFYNKNNIMKSKKKGVFLHLLGHSSDARANEFKNYI